MANIHENTFSERLSECMNLSGYSFRMIKYRQRMNEHMDSIFNSNSGKSHNTVMTTGGKGEGTAKYFESDIDRLYALEGVVCVNNENGNKRRPALSYQGNKDKANRTPDMALIGGCVAGPDVTVFELNTSGCSPGYARLRLKQRGSGYHLKTIEASLVHEMGDVYLDNSFPKLDKEKYQMFDVNVKNIDADQKTGPSQPYSNPDISYDFVNGITYTDRRMLHAWAQRPRLGDWPSPCLVKDVCETQGQLVPVADKNSKHSRTEWRICFTEAELLLVRGLTECHIKVLILLKLIAKSMLKPICKDISSYAIKNITMWIAERHPTACFTHQTLYVRCVDALRFLRECILEGQLKNYMIADRNLFASRISSVQKWKLIAKIDDLLIQKTNMFDCLGNIGNTLQLLDADDELHVRTLSVQRDSVECLFLQKNVEFKKIECQWFRLNYTVEFEDLAERHDQFNMLDEQMKALLVPEKDDLDNSEVIRVFQERLRNILT